MFRRALLAGGFGTGKQVFERPLEIAPVIPSGGDKVSIAALATLTSQSQKHHALNFQRRHPISCPPTPPNGKALDSPISEGGDEEEGGQKRLEKVWNCETGSMEEPVVSTLHPRFHLDLASAVAAACGHDDW